MRIKILASVHPNAPTPGPYEALDIIEAKSAYQVGDMSHYGEVVLILPLLMFPNDGIEQAVVVERDSGEMGTLCEESVYERPPDSYDMIEFAPIAVDTSGWSENPPLTGPYTVLASEKLTIEDVAHLTTSKTYSLWKKNCFVSKRTADSLESVRFAIVHRYPSRTERDKRLQARSVELINSASLCLALIRPTRKSQAIHVRGVSRPDGTFDPQSFSVNQPVDVPEIQKLFAVREQDVRLLIAVFPEFFALYPKDSDGKVPEDYEPLRMAAQLYAEAYSLWYWKARHLLWWSAIEALFGSSEDAAMARIYAFFGNGDLANGYGCPIYEAGDIPSCFTAAPKVFTRLGKWFHSSMKCATLLLTVSEFLIHILYPCLTH